MPPQEQEFSREILSAISRNEVRNKHELNSMKLRLAKKFGIRALPTDPDILILARIKNPSAKARAILSVKPVRSLSGIAVVAAMVKPHPCPGKCIYCPSGIENETPKSYTGREPAAMRGLMFKFDPYMQAANRIEQLERTGHSTEKIELIVMGGTFLSMPVRYQNSFVKGLLDAASGKKSKGIAEAKLIAEHAKRRVTGITFETRPDFCSAREINRILGLCGTRVELGVQALDDAIYKKINRGHTVQDVVQATALLKDSALKVLYHVMPGLPGSSPEQDLSHMRELFSNPDYRPDMLKFYPCLVMEGTPLHKEWKRGNYTPLSSEDAAKLLAKAKKYVPRYCRIMRIQRDIPSNLVSAGVRHTNLRQLVEHEAERQGIKCKCIRCREAGLAEYKHGANASASDAKILHEQYEASAGTEVFISAESKGRELLFGFCRLRIPALPFRHEITMQSALVRELRVYGESLPLGTRKKTSYQHTGLGKKLMLEAECLALEKFDARQMLVLSGIGVREYYSKQLGYSLNGAYMAKTL
ncbi:MAG: tRNA uridine(34) 5-carboxymethylaminomethyl modification radical SAM/GNAT enzyme Elp3 [Candidatus Diapherotrites archaeon]|nr:tRNA uridine(34) 5-carboxymethylaminomethyl modification radical SAM/GNAT enzyme Elp3 [Candidatus Micrarchaeota archaeon]MBU1939697.1 tRNA uridine(34) 5-carboxymethylaminomethyl modification radical SAM/GNAT enzyme Elp3 [Candidatus Micrarchaeota archaeon]